jgi:hypothetical protein
LVAATGDSGEIVVEEAGETVVGRAVEHAVLEWACSEVETAYAAPVDKLVAVEHAAVEVVDVEVGAVEDVEYIETVEVVVDLVVDAFVTQLPPVDCKWVDWAYKHSWVVVVAAVEKLAYVGVEEGGGEHFLDGYVLEKRVSRGAEAAEKDRDGGKCHSALEVRQMACPCAGTLAGFADDAASWHGLVVNETQVDLRRPHRRHHHHLRLSSP